MASVAARSRPSCGMPISLSEVGAPICTARSYKPCAASAVPSAPAHQPHRFRRRIAIEGCRVRQDHRMDLCVRKVERSAQCVTQLVMDRHAYRAERRSPQPGAVLRIGARLEIGRLHARQREASGTTPECPPRPSALMSGFASSAYRPRRNGRWHSSLTDPKSAAAAKASARDRTAPSPAAPGDRALFF